MSLSPHPAREAQADRLVQHQLARIGPEDIGLRLKPDGYVTFTMDVFNAELGLRDGHGVRRDYWGQALTRRLAEAMRVFRDHGPALVPGWDPTAPDWAALRVAVEKRGCPSAADAGVIPLAAAVRHVVASAKETGAGDGKAPPSPAPTPDVAADAMSAEDKALGVFASNQSLPLAEVARRAGCTRQHLYKCDRFMQAYRLYRASARDACPRGMKDADGSIEAWREDG